MASLTRKMNTNHLKSYKFVSPPHFRPKAYVLAWPQTLPCSVHMFTFGSSVGPSRCCCSLPSQTRLNFPPTAEIRDHRGSILACHTWHFLVRVWTDSFTPLCPYCHVSTHKFMVVSPEREQAEDFVKFFFFFLLV